MVAQSRNNACVWYNIDTPDRLSIFPIKGEIVDIVRVEGKTEVSTSTSQVMLPKIIFQNIN